MLRLYTLFVLLSMLFLVGCGGTVPTQTIETFFDAAGNITKEIVSGAVDRDNLYLERGNERDKQTAAMYTTQGVKVTMERYTYVSPDGSFTYTSNDVKEVTARAPHSYQQKIETRPPDHRGWNSLDNVVDRGFQGVLAWLTAGVLDNSIDRSSPTYRGDYVNQSYNPVTNTEIPFLVE